MSWENDLVTMLRVLIGDLNSPQKNTDVYLKKILITAGILVVNDIDLSQDYIFDISNITIIPDPVSLGDIRAQALLPLKAACILGQADFRVAISQSITVRDGDSMIQTGVGLGGYADILRLGPCKSYELLLNKLNASASSLVGGAVLGAYRAPGDGAIETVAFFYDQISSLPIERISIRH
jgi:hypothetical protein